MAVAIVVIVVVVVLVVVGLALAASRRAQRRRELQEQYGPEYDRAVEQTGSRRAAERDLAERREQRAQLQVVPLSAESRTRYSQTWAQVQSRFVDDPQGAVSDADDLVTAVMRERGYPTEGGFDQQARLLSVDHATTLENYRDGHRIADLARQSQATTEQLRQGMVQYRTLFQELVEEQGTESGQATQHQPGGDPQQGQYQQQPPQTTRPDARPASDGPMEQPTRQMPRPPMPPGAPQSPMPQAEPPVPPGSYDEPYPGEATNPQGLRRQTGPGAGGEPGVGR